MKRRDAIKRTALLMGYAVSASAIAGVMNGCKADPEAVKAGPGDWNPEFFTKEEGNMVAQMAECIIPKTDTPGAIDAGVHSFIDIFMKDNATQEEQKAIKKGLIQFNEACKTNQGAAFVDCSMKQQTKFLQEQEKAAVKQLKKDSEAPNLWFSFKELTMLGYFTSEVGAKEFLIYDPIPGDYQACIPYEEVNGTWALR